MNPNKLRAVMALRGDTGKVLSEVLNITQSRFSAKLTGRGGAQFTQGEIQAIKDRYDLTAKQVDDIFFDVRVS